MIAALALAAAALAACFAAPQPVRIDGWSDDAMEPFVSRDGALLFFNSSNAPGRQTDIFWARRLDPLHYHLEGPVAGANSKALDGVASLSREGGFALISPRAYGRLHATVWLGRWTGSAVEGLHPEPRLTPRGPGGFDMDAEIAADGTRLYVSESRWNPFGPPKTATLAIARRDAGGFAPDPDSPRILAAVNAAGALDYAAATSEDERELFFTRAQPARGAAGAPRIWVATRSRADAPFSPPAKLEGLGGFVEGPSVAPDGALYFHSRVAGRFTLMRAERRCGAAGPLSP